MKSKRIVDLELVRYIRKLACVACGKPGPNDAHHVKTKGSGGGDTIENLVALCREHHQLIHIKGLSFMAEKFPSIKRWLVLAKWKFDPKAFVWRHDKE